ncbi:MAG: insulinase family protein [Candidatus Niyogibacteria bacterium]|nr:insulinase family protein [Candidatus Niyogibacteria bacterium]
MKIYKESELVNGLKIITSEDKNSDIVTLAIWVRAGSRYEEQDELGYAHLLEHMLLKGTKSKPSFFDISLITDRAGAYSNASTNAEIIKVVIQVAKEHWEKMFSLLADIIINLDLQEHILENEKKVVIQESKRFYDNNERHLWLETVAKVFEGHPLSNHPLGTEECILSATPARLYEYYRRYFRPNRMVLMVCGAVGQAEVVASAEKEFGAMDRGADALEHLVEPSGTQGSAFKLVPGLQTYLNFSFRGQVGSHKDSLILNLLANYLGYKHTSLLYQKLRHALGLVYSISAYAVFFRDATLFYIATSSTTPKEVIPAVIDLLENLEGHLTPQLLEEYKEQYINILKRLFNNPIDEIESLGNYWNIYNRMISLSEIENEVKNINYREVMEVKNRYLTKTNLSLIGLGGEDIDLSQYLK